MKKVLYIVVAVGILVNLGYLGKIFNGEAEFVESYGDSVVLYSTSWCGYCKKTRELLEKNNIAYAEFDIEHSKAGRKEYDALNGRGVPLLVMGGEILRGYDPKSILRLAKQS